jgi:hypothetical protein
MYEKVRFAANCGQSSRTKRQRFELARAVQAGEFLVVEIAPF